MVTSMITLIRSDKPNMKEVSADVITIFNIYFEDVMLVYH